MIFRVYGVVLNYRGNLNPQWIDWVVEFSYSEIHTKSGSLKRIMGKSVMTSDGGKELGVKLSQMPTWAQPSSRQKLGRWRKVRREFNG